MNLFFGKMTTAGNLGNADKRIARHCEKHFTTSPSLFLRTKSALLGCARTAGKLTGSAQRGDITLVFTGFFFEPFPLSINGKALENPDAVAEALLTRYLETDKAFLDNLLGYYALALVNTHNNEVLLATDPYGQRSLFIHSDDGTLSFGSNLAATLTMLDEPVLDRSWEDFFLVYGFYPYGGTPYEGVISLSSGKLLSWKDGETAQRDIVPVKPEVDDVLEEGAPLSKAIDKLYDGFMRALEQQSADTNDVGVLLGGFDSALVAAGLKRLGKNVSTWSFYYDQQEYNQPHTEDLAEFLGIQHHWVRVTQLDIEEGIEEFPYQFNQPTNWPNYVVQTALVMKKMKESGVELAYSGDGCDTVFLGYPGTWRRARVIEKVPTLPQGMIQRFTRIAARPFLERSAGHPYRVVLNLLRTSAWPRHARGFLSFRILDEVSLHQLRQDNAPAQQQPIEKTVTELATPHAGLPSLRLAYLGKSLVSPNKNKMNGSSDISGIPILSPYMHPAFKRLAQSLPEDLCRPNEATASRVTGKYALMKMAEEKELLPSAVIYQKKMAAVDAPIDRWYAGPMREFMLKQFEALPFRANRKYLESLLASHFAEQLFQKYFLTDKVIKHAPSLLVTYARFCALSKDVANKNAL